MTFPNAGLPRRIYFVKVIPGGRRLGYAEKGGGKYTDLRLATEHLQRLHSRGVNAKLYESQVIEWTEVETDPIMRGAI